MSDTLEERTAPVNVASVTATTTTMSILVALSVAHMLNDTLQALISSMYPVIKEAYKFTYAEIGMITFVFQMSSSVLQPIVGNFADRRPMPYSLAFGMALTLIGLIMLSMADSYHAILVAAVFVGSGSAIFHPEASRLAHMAAGQKHGFAQSLFQLGGNFGSSLGPLLTAWIVVPRGQRSVAWFSILACMGIGLLAWVGRWYAVQMRHRQKTHKAIKANPLPRGKTIAAITVLLLLLCSKFFYSISLTNYYTFYLIHKFGVTIQMSQICLFVFLFAYAAGTILGGPLGDRFGRKAVIWISVLGAAPFALAMPYMGLTGTVILSALAGMIIASAFSAILVFAQELLPGRVGLIAGLFFGFAFGISAIASATLGKLADAMGIDFVFHVCAFLPLLGLLAVFLPKIQRKEAAA